MPDAKRRSSARRPTRTTACLLVVTSALAGETLRAGPPPATIKGKVTGWEKLVPAVYAESSKNDARSYTWREPSPTVKQDFRRLSANVTRDVCIVALDASGAAPQAHEPLPVRVTGGRTTPATIVLSPNSRLSFKNDDPFAHELYETGNDKWAATPTAPGSSREWAAGAPGLHEIHDRLFSSIVMYVVVDPAAVEFAFPDHDGAFAMSLPAGDYNFKAYFDGKPVGKDPTPVHVLDRGLLELREPMALGSDAK